MAVSKYDPAAVNKAIAASKPKIGKKEASAIHALLKGRTGDRRARLHAALDEVFEYRLSKPPVTKKIYSILNKDDLKKMTGPKGSELYRAKDASPFDRDTDAGAAALILREHQAGASAKDIVKQYGFDQRFVDDVIAYKYGRSLAEFKKTLAKDVAPVGDTKWSVEYATPEGGTKIFTVTAESAEAARTAAITSAKKFFGTAYSKTRGFPAERTKDVTPVGDAEWIGEPPSNCDVCSKPIKNVFIDGATRGGPWGNMCRGCHMIHGVGLGTGRGQRYEKQDSGVWAKTGDSRDNLEHPDEYRKDARDEGKTEVFTVKQGAWQLRLDGKVLPTTWNSKGAAEAAIPVERKRRAKDAQDHPDPAVQAKVDKYRATALAQGFKPENVERSIRQLLDEGRFKATSKVSDAAFKPGDKVWANPIGKSGGTVKGTVERINASGQVVIESGGREHEFHPSNVRASDVRPVGDELWTPGHKNPVPAGWLKLSREAMRAAGEAQVAAAKYDKYWPENRTLFAALRRMNEAQNKGDEARLLKEAAVVMAETASKRAGDVRPVGDYAGQQADGALAVLKRTIAGNPHNLSKAHLDVLKARVAKLEAKAAKSKAKDAGGTYDVSHSLNGPVVLQVTASQFHEWARKNGVNLSNFKSTLEGLRKFTGDPHIKDWEMDA